MLGIDDRPQEVVDVVEANVVEFLLNLAQCLVCEHKMDEIPIRLIELDVVAEQAYFASMVKARKSRLLNYSFLT